MVLSQVGAGQCSILAKRTRNIIDISIDLAVTSRALVSYSPDAFAVDDAASHGGPKASLYDAAVQADGKALWHRSEPRVLAAGDFLAWAISDAPTARRDRLARARAAVKNHTEYSEHAYFLAVETAFTKWEALQNAGRQDQSAQWEQQCR